MNAIQLLKFHTLFTWIFADQDIRKIRVVIQLTEFVIGPSPCWTSWIWCDVCKVPRFQIFNGNTRGIKEVEELSQA